MNKTTKIVVGIIVAIGVIGLLYAMTQQPAVGPTKDSNTNAASTGQKMIVDQPVKIGVILPLTGNAASYGTPLQRAAQMALKAINAAGGIGGNPVEAIWEDGKCEGKEATAAAQRLINVEGVRIIFGGACSGETLAIAPLAQEKKVLVISPSATSPDVTAAGEFIFRTAPSDAFAGKVAAEYAYRNLEKRAAAVIAETTDYGQALRRVFTERFQALGGNVVADVTYHTTETNFASQIVKIKAAKPDVIYLVPQTPAPGVQVVKQLNSQEVTTQLLTAEVLIGRDIVGENGKLMEGLIGVETYFNQDGPRAKAFFDAYVAEYQEQPSYAFFMANMHGQFFLIKDGIEKVGLDTEKLRDWLTAVNNWEGTMGQLTFDANGDPVLDAYAIMQVKDGKLEQIEIYSTNQ